MVANVLIRKDRKMQPKAERHYRAHIYWRGMDGRLSISPAVDVFAFSYDDAAKKVAGAGVIEHGSINQLAAKVWDLNGRCRLYYRR